jgi:hypothetical protein
VISLPAKTYATGDDAVLKARSACVEEDATTSVATAEFAPKAWLVALTVAVSVIVVPAVVPAVTFTTNSTVPLVPAGAVGPVQVTLPVAPTASDVHVVPVGGVIETNVVFAGVVSTNVGLLAVPVPTLVATCV